MSPNAAFPSRPRALLPFALSLAVSLLLSACADGGDGAPAAKTPTPVVERAANPPPAAAAEQTGVEGGPAALIGRTLPPYPDGLSEVQGVCVPGGEQLERICDYGLAVLGHETVDHTATTVYLIASANADPEAKQPLWRVTDAIDMPPTKAGYELQLGGCRLGGELSNEVVAVVRHGDKEYSADVAWAKRLDIASGKFVAVERAQVDCVNTGFGL